MVKAIIMDAGDHSDSELQDLVRRFCEDETKIDFITVGMEYIEIHSWTVVANHFLNDKFFLNFRTVYFFTSQKHCFLRYTLTNGRITILDKPKIESSRPLPPPDPRWIRACGYEFGMPEVAEELLTIAQKQFVTGFAPPTTIDVETAKENAARHTKDTKQQDWT